MSNNLALQNNNTAPEIWYLEDVAAFFRKSPRTLQNQLTKGVKILPPAIKVEGSPKFWYADEVLVYLEQFRIAHEASKPTQGRPRKALPKLNTTDK